MSEYLDFADKVVLITGSSCGLGAEVAKEFAKNGAQLVITGKNCDAIAKVANECHALSPNGQVPLQIVADVTVDDDLKNLIETTIDQFGQIDVLVNYEGAASFAEIDDPKLIDDMDHMFRLNVRSVVVLTQLAVPHIEKTKGSIINISSVAALKAFEGCSAYSMAKASLDMFTRCMAIELGPKGIRVNSVNPTIAMTGFQVNSGSNAFDGFGTCMEKASPLRKIPLPLDIANAILFLASNKSAYITGITLPIDSDPILI